MKRTGFLKRTNSLRAKRDPFGLRKRSISTGRKGRGLADAKWARQVKERDNYTCQYPECFKSYKSIDAHHIAMRSRRPDLKCAVSNGITLCRTHHTWVHENSIKATRMGLLSADSYEKAKKEIAA